MHIYLAILTYLDKVTFQPKTIGFCTGEQGFLTRPMDSLPNFFFYPYIKTPLNYVSRIFRDGLTAGCGETSFGTLQLINRGGSLDYLQGQIFDGQQVQILWGDCQGNMASLSDFVPILTGVMCPPEFGWGAVNFRVRDYSELLAKPISQFVYLGCNVGGQGCEGTTDDLMGKTKPGVWGRVWNWTPAYESTAWSIYGVHAYGPVKAIDGVKTMGIPIPQDMALNGGVTESAACAYVSPTSFTVAGNKTAVYTAGLRLLIVQTSGGSTANAGNAPVASSSYNSGTGLTTVVLSQPGPGVPQMAFTLVSGDPISKVAYGGGDYPTLAALVAAQVAGSITMGMYATCLAVGKFALSGNAGTAITCDVQGDATGGVYVDTIAGILQRVFTTMVQRPRKTYLPWNDQFTQGNWVMSGFTPSTPSGVTPPVTGMNLTQVAGAAGSSLSCVLPLGTGMFCLPWYVQGAGSVRLMISNPANEANNCLADFNLATGAWSNVQANGNAVGPQYQSTGFITAANVIAEPNGFWRIWLAGQPDSTFTQLKVKIISNDGSPIILGRAQVEQYSSPSLDMGPSTATAVGSDTVGSFYAIAYDPPLGMTVDGASFAALACQVPYETGYAVGAGETTSILDMANALCGSDGCWFDWERNGITQCGQFTKPSPTATPVATITESDFLQDSLQWIQAFQTRDNTPPFRVVMSALKNWTIQRKADLSTSMWTNNPMRVAWLGDEFRDVRAEDLNVLGVHPLACELNFTCYFNLADAYAAAARLLALYTGQLDRYSFIVKQAVAVNLNIGSIINLQAPRLDLTNGKNFVVVGLTEKHETGQVTVEVLG